MKLTVSWRVTAGSACGPIPAGRADWAQSAAQVVSLVSRLTLQCRVSPAAAGTALGPTGPRVPVERGHPGIGRPLSAAVVERCAGSLRDADRAGPLLNVPRFGLPYSPSCGEVHGAIT